MNDCPHVFEVLSERDLWCKLCGERWEQRDRDRSDGDPPWAVDSAIWMNPHPTIWITPDSLMSSGSA